MQSHPLTLSRTRTTLSTLYSSILRPAPTMLERLIENKDRKDHHCRDLYHIHSSNRPPISMCAVIVGTFPDTH